MAKKSKIGSPSQELPNSILLQHPLPKTKKFSDLVKRGGNFHFQKKLIRKLTQLIFEKFNDN